MAVLWCGGEDVDFPNGTTVTVNTTAGNFRAGYARCGVTSTSTSAPIVSTLFPGGGVTSGWLSCQFMPFTNTTNTGQLAVAFASPSTSSGIGVRMLTSGNGGTAPYYLTIATYSGSSFITLATSQFTYNPGVLVRIDLQIINYGASGTANLYCNGALIATYTGNLTTGGATSLSAVSSFAYLGTVGYISEVVVANEPTFGWSLATLAPSGNGTTQQWSNPAYTNTNPTAINDANAAYSNTIGQDEQVTLTALPSGNLTVKVVKAIARAAAPSGASSTNIKLGFNNGSTVAVGSAIAVGTGFAPAEQYFSTDPTTGGAWSTLTNYQLDLRSA